MNHDAEALSLLSDVLDARIASGLNTPPQLLGHLKSSAMDGRIKIFRSTTKVPIGYVAWANVNKYSFLMTTKTRQMPPYLYEWSEGRLMIVYDVVFAPQWNLIAKKALLKFLKKKRFVSFFRRGRLHLWVRSGGKPAQALF